GRDPLAGDGACMALSLAPVHPVHRRGAVHAHLPRQERDAQQYAGRIRPARSRRHREPARLARHHHHVRLEAGAVHRAAARRRPRRDLLSDDGRHRLDLSAPFPAPTPGIRPMTRALAGTLAKAVLLALLAFAIIGPLANLVIWSFAERWYFPFKLPSVWGVR